MGKAARWNDTLSKARREKAIRAAEDLGEDERHLSAKEKAAARSRRYRARQRGDDSPAAAKRSPGRVSRDGQLRAALIEANGQIAMLEQRVEELEAEIAKFRQRRRH